MAGLGLFRLRLNRGAPCLLLTLALICGAASRAQTPEKVFGNPNAPKGGTYYGVLNAEPETLDPISSSDLYAQQVQSYVMDRLLVRNPETYELEAGLAEKWEVAKDGLSITFHIRKDVKWHDGKPLTVEDVKFSFDAIMDNRFKAAQKRPYYENIGGVEILDPSTVKFLIKKKYYANLDVLGDLMVVPKHVYGDPDKKVSKVLVGSGAYSVEKYDRGKNLVLKRNPNWWGLSVPLLKASANYERVFLRFVKEEELQLEMLKKGQIDFAGLTPEAYSRKTQGPPFGKTVLVKKIENLSPKGFSFVGWNLENPLFKEKDVRVALAHLTNRKLMNEKFRYGMSLLATGPWYQQNPYADKSVKPIAFDPKKAAELLAKQGWHDSDKNGVLDKMIDGKKVEFSFTLLLANRDSEKYMTVYKEDLKKAGINMDIKIVEWNSFVKSLDERKFDAVMLGWGGGSIEGDPKQIWHSDSRANAGSNFIGYSNKEVDALIDAGREELDKEKRKKIWMKVYKLIADDAPYVFLFNDRYGLYAHSSRIHMEKPTYKYDIGDQYWWVNP